MSIELRHAAACYQSADGEVEAVRDVSFAVTEGAFVSLVGPSGCGKSTLFHGMAGLTTPVSGSVLLHGEDVTGRPGRVSYMLQKDLLLPQRTIMANVCLPLTLAGTPRAAAREKAEPLFERKNTGDNTPAVLHVRLVPGDRIRLKLAPKGAGSENKSALKMLVPADGIEGVKKFVVDTVKAAGSSPCPPMVVGVGIGGTLELAGLCAKRAAMRDVDTRNPDPRYAAFEEELLGLLNDLGTGPQGLGGTTTAFKVNVEFCATHIASLPVAVNINCHAARHAEAEL